MSMVIQKITHPDITRNVTMEASEYFKTAINGWVIVTDAGVLYFPPEEWQIKPEYITIHILEDDWDTFHSLCLWKADSALRMYLWCVETRSRPASLTCWKSCRKFPVHRLNTPLQFLAAN